MIELPTPETDALFCRNGYPVEVDSSKAMQLCEKLEQERDWITEKFKLLEGCFKRAERERDEAREKYFVMRVLSNNATELSEKYKRQRNEAREALKKIKHIYINGGDTYLDFVKANNIATDYLEGL